MANQSVRIDGRFKTAFLVGLTCLWSYDTTPSYAQTGYLPWAVGSSMLQPLRYFTYSPWGGTGYSNPLWYGGKILQQSTRGVGGGSYGGYSPYGNPNFYAINGDEHGLNQNQNPQQGSQQVIRYGYPTFNNSGANGGNSNNSFIGNNGGGNNNGGSSNNGSNPQTSQASGTSAFEAARNRRKKSGSNNSGGNGNNNGASGNNGSGNSVFSANESGTDPSIGQPSSSSHFSDADPFLTPLPGSSSMPPAPRVGAGSFNSSADSPSAYSGSTGSYQGQSDGYSGGHYGSGQNASTRGSGKYGVKPLKMGKNAPFASSFIDTVNNKYNGDIQSALNDQNTRAMAHNLGLVNGGNANLNLSEERKNVIGRIMHDDSLDAASKMAAVKALLH